MKTLLKERHAGGRRAGWRCVEVGPPPPLPSRSLGGPVLPCTGRGGGRAAQQVAEVGKRRISVSKWQRQHLAAPLRALPGEEPRPRCSSAMRAARRRRSDKRRLQQGAAVLGTHLFPDSLTQQICT